MTLLEAKSLAESVLGYEVLTPETLVTRIYNAVCMREDNTFRVYGDGVLLGESSEGPSKAWEEASLNLPDDFYKPFRVETTLTEIFYRKESDEEDHPPGSCDRTSSERPSLRGCSNSSRSIPYTRDGTPQRSI